MVPQFIDAESIERILPLPDLIDAMEGVFGSTAVASPRSHLDTGDGSLLLMPAWEPGRYTGTKLVTIRLENRERGLPTVHGLYALFDGVTGQPLAVMDGRVLTVKRTAATSAMAARHLARRDAETHLLIGAGALAPYLIRAMRCVRPIKRVLIWNRSAEARDRLVNLLAPKMDAVIGVEDLGEAVREADIISTATQSRVPLVYGRDVSPGTHLDLVGAYSPEMAEADGEALAGAHIVVDTWEGAKAEAGDLIQAVEKGVMSWDEVAGDLRALVTNQIPGRTSREQVTAFKSVGASIEDLAAAALAWDRHNLELP